MRTYDSEKHYVESAQSLRDKINNIELVIEGLISSAMTAVANSDVKEYFLDDGQTKIRSVYRSSEEIMNAVSSWEKIKSVYVNRLNGRTFRLRSVTNTPRRY